MILKTLLRLKNYPWAKSAKALKQKGKPETFKSGDLMLKPVASEVRLNYCMFLASHSVTALKKSSWWDDASYLHEYFKFVPAFYPLSESELETLWVTKNVKMPGFGNEDFTKHRENVDSILASEATSSFKVELSKTTFLYFFYI